MNELKNWFYLLLLKTPFFRKHRNYCYEKLGVTFVKEEPYSPPIIEKGIKIKGEFSNVVLHNACSMYYGTLLVARDKIEIGCNTAIAYGVTINTSANPDPHNLLFKKYGRTHAPVIIGNNCWICANVTILQGVTIGECCVIGAGAVVTEDIPPYSLAVGIPAKVVKTFHDLEEIVKWNSNLEEK